jgi:hypothetical protein
MTELGARNPSILLAAFVKGDYATRLIIDASVRHHQLHAGIRKKFNPRTGESRYA